MDRLYRHLHMPYEIAIEFIATFSRAEHALKSTSYVLGDEKKVVPDWDKFANEIHEEFEINEDTQITEAVNELLEHPPRKQVLVNRKVVFKNQSIDKKQKRTQQAILMIRTVRNNLFHGGKYLPNGEVENGRNERLVRASLIVLNECLRLNDDVRASFEY